MSFLNRRSGALDTPERALAYWASQVPVGSTFRRVAYPGSGSALLHLRALAALAQRGFCRVGFVEVSSGRGQEVTRHLGEWHRLVAADRGPDAAAYAALVSLAEIWVSGAAWVSVRRG